MNYLSPIILASSSPYRKQLLHSLRLDFTTMSPKINESQLANEDAIDMVKRLARDKAAKVQVQHPKACVVGSDQVCTLAGQIYGKPGSSANAVKQLHAFSDRYIKFFTGLCVMTATGNIYSHVDQTSVRFRSLSQDEIKRYIDKEQPLDCAGSFKVESLGLSLFESVESNDPSALMGLPLIKLSEFLRLSGYQIP